MTDDLAQKRPTECHREVAEAAVEVTLLEDPLIEPDGHDLLDDGAARP